MALMTWGPALAVGFGDIDVQHRRLVELINEVDEARRAPEGDRDRIEHVLVELLRYTRLHFAFEEKLMMRYGVDDPGHVARHRSLTSDVGAFVERFGDGGEDITDDLMAFLHEWLRFHIRKEDRQLVADLVDRGAVSAVASVA